MQWYVYKIILKIPLFSKEGLEGYFAILSNAHELTPMVIKPACFLPFKRAIVLVFRDILPNNH
jgi:hypothetical protein